MRQTYIGPHLIIVLWCCWARCRVIQQQYLLATAAHHLGVGQRFAKTVRIETKVDDGGRPRAWMAVQRQDKTYTLDDVHVVGPGGVGPGGTRAGCSRPHQCHVCHGGGYSALLP